MILTLHGTGAGDPGGDRMASALTATFDDGSIVLFDAGEGCSRAMLRDGIDLMRIDAVAISHMHADHWAGMPNLLMAWSVNKRREPVVIYIPEGTADFFERILTISYNFRERLTYEVTYVTHRSFPLREGWSASTFATHHLDSVREFAEKHHVPTTAFGYLLTNGDRKIVLSQDIGGIDDLRGVIDDAELLVCESAHVEPREALDRARDARVRRVIFTHVPPTPPAFPDDFSGVEWSVASDGDRLDL